ncbi:MAG: transglycosylase SLT domain-containing protein [Chitinispirillaceae bacterium]|nr:transglycosylase SLT domain-containing protein [Chitinispirillaceae bacterium]
MPFYYLEIIRGIDQGRRFLLEDGAISIGRSSSNTVAISPAEKSVSGHHAILYKNGERFVIQDLNSTNGSFVNEERVEEREIFTNDIIGLGKTGPRLKLIVSDTKLDTSQPPNTNLVLDVSTTIKTQEERVPSKKISNIHENAFPFTKDATDSEERKTILRLKDTKLRKIVELDKKPSVTIELQKKLIEDSISPDDMALLMKDGKRLEKILNSGEIDETQAALLRKAYKASISFRNKVYYLIISLIFISVIGISFFAIRANQYKSVVTKAIKLKKELEKYEQEIAQAKKEPEKNREKLEKLIDRLEEKQKSLSHLKEQMTEDDFGDYYADPIEKKIDEILSRFGESDYHIPQEMIDRVKYHVEYYSTKLKDVVARYLKRKDKYFPMINQTLRQKNLPLELAYVSMLESGFNPMALSHAGARGLWQFMPETGRRYGLRVDGNIDERCDPIKSTYAAAEYFKDLIGIFGGKSSVMLCMAAYNAGEGKVINALRKIDDPMRNRDFWYLYRMGYLPEETKEYIPRVIAFIIISENPDEYGFGDYTKVDTTSLESEKDFIEFDYKIE